MPLVSERIAGAVQRHGDVRRFRRLKLYSGEKTMDTIGSFKLTNNGGFVCAGKVQYIDPNGFPKRSDRWHYINVTESETMNPSEKGVPSGSLIEMYIDIVAGNDRTGGTYFIYDPSSNRRAEYSITGTTLNSHVHFDGIRS
jgi:hypothetical protein